MQTFLLPRVRGFTLIELLIVLSVATLLLTVGVSSFNDFIRTTQVDTISTRLRTALSLARGEAVQRGAKVVLCRSNSAGTACAGTGASGQQEWSGGWLLFVDANENRQYDASGQDELLRTFPALEPAYIVKWNRGDQIGYQANGMLWTLNGTFCLGTRDGDSDYARELVIPSSGRVRTTRGACPYALVP